MEDKSVSGAEERSTCGDGKDLEKAPLNSEQRRQHLGIDAVAGPAPVLPLKFIAGPQQQRPEGRPRDMRQHTGDVGNGENKMRAVAGTLQRRNTGQGLQSGRHQMMGLCGPGSMMGPIIHASDTSLPSPVATS